MRQLLVYCVTAVVMMFSFSCKDEEGIELRDIIFDMDFESPPSELVGDGSTTVTLVVTLNPGAARDKREVVFRTDGGLFENGTAEFKKEADRFKGDLLAKGVLTMPRTAGDFVVTAEVNLEDQLGFFVDSVLFNVERSLPVSVDVSFDSLFSVAGNFQGLVEVRAKVSNMAGKGVSSGFKVVFSDEAEDPDQLTMDSRFSMDTVNLNNLSEASVYYSPGLTSLNSFVIISVEVIDENGVQSGITSNSRLYIKP